MSITAMKQAMEALLVYSPAGSFDAITALRTAMDAERERSIMSIKPWDERLKETEFSGNELAYGISPTGIPPSVFCMKAEIDELRAALLERDA